jgi:hypothetical protein
MAELRTYEFAADVDTLRRAGERGVYVGTMESAVRTLVSELLSRVRDRPRAVYLCSPDRDAEARDRLAYILAKLLREHVPGVLLVDCAFLSVGLSGIVPHRDALGFLDLLLYGTSLGVITQEAHGGVKVIGAGSFAVTKKSPFVMDSFASARRYLVNQAKCVIFVGPATDDGDNLHPLADNVDLILLIRAADRFAGRALDPYEEKVASVQGVEAWSVRINTRVAGARQERAAEVPERAGKGEPTLVAEIRDIAEKPGVESAAPRGRAPDRPVPPPTPGAPPRGRPPVESQPTAAKEPLAGGAPGDLDELDRADWGRRVAGSRVVRLIASVVLLVVVVFVVWWFYLTRPVRDRGGERATTGGPQQAAVPSPPRRGEDSTVTAATTTGVTGGDLRSDTTAAAHDTTQVAGRPSPGGAQPSREVAAAETQAPESLTRDVSRRYFVSTADSIYSAESLDEFSNRYVIHVSSFRGREKAKEEAFYLAGWGYPVFMYRVDLGSKGTWYRVYVGPYGTREEATRHKIKLDENPRIQSTRISKVPG